MARNSNANNGEPIRSTAYIVVANARVLAAHSAVNHAARVSFRFMKPQNLPAHLPSLEDIFMLYP